MCTYKCFFLIPCVTPPYLYCAMGCEEECRNDTAIHTTETFLSPYRARCMHGPLVPNPHKALLSLQLQTCLDEPQGVGEEDKDYSGLNSRQKMVCGVKCSGPRCLQFAFLYILLNIRMRLFAINLCIFVAVEVSTPRHCRRQHSRTEALEQTKSRFFFDNRTKSTDNRFICTPFLVKNLLFINN